METQRFSSFIQVLLTSLFLVVSGWGGLAVIIIETRPTLGPRWLFFFFIVLAITGTILPFVAFLNRRFSSEPGINSSVVVRQSLWVGIYVSLLCWLQLGKVLSSTLAVTLAIALTLIELILRMFERSRFKPRDLADE